ncbi:MAG: DUF389 domain-containing protein [Planctomycetota bacterium]
MSTALVLLDEPDLSALAWAARIASRLGGPLVVIHPSEQGSYRFRAVSGSGDDVPDLAIRATELLPDAGAGDGRVYVCRGPDTRRTVLHAMHDLEVKRLVVRTSIGDRGENALVRSIVRAAPADVIMIDPGEMGDRLPERVIVPQTDGGAAFALRLAVRVLGDASCPVVAVPDPDRLGRSRRVVSRVQASMPAGLRDALEEGPEATSLEEGIASSVAPGDLVLFDAEHSRRVSKLLGGIKQLRKEKADVPFTVALTRSADAAGPGRLERAMERTRLYAPQLSREERKELYTRLEAGGRVSTDFVMMLMLSAAIASLGLIQSSAAVVIGAMLVAPLMTPLVAMGMAIVQGNMAMFRESRRAMLIGTVGALAVSVAIGLLSPWSELSAEVSARGTPNPFDLAIAFFSGIAAAYAMARPGLAGTLVGVAIAVALVPPLAGVGIALSKWNLEVVYGASVLFITNLLAITIGAALVFRFFGVRVLGGEATMPRWARITIALIMAGVALTLAPLTMNLGSQTQMGVDREYSRPLNVDLRDAIRARVAEEAGVDIVFMAHSEIEGGFGVVVALLCERGVTSNLRDDIREMVRQDVGDEMEIRVLLMQAGAVTE